jgi:hypothetical protein
MEASDALQLRNAGKEHDALQKTKDSLQSISLKLVEETKFLDKKASEARVKALQGEEKRLIIELDQENKIGEEATTQQQKYQAELDTLQKQIERAQKEKSKGEITKEIKTIQDDLEKLKKKDLLEKSIADIATENESIENAIKKNEEEKTRLQALQTEINQLTQKNTASATEENNLKQANERQKQDINRLANVEQENKNAIDKLKAEQDRLKTIFSQKVEDCIKSPSFNLQKVNTLLKHCGNAEVKKILDTTPLETKLQEHKKICTTIEEAKAILARKYDENAVKNVLPTLENLPAYLSQEQKNEVDAYKQALKGYCKMNKIAYLTYQGVLAYLPYNENEARSEITKFLTTRKNDLKYYTYIIKQFELKYQDIGNYAAVLTESFCN